jgi:peptidoglycan/xylan/chitin deacetylase (PgdA/CDA1 family)
VIVDLFLYIAKFTGAFHVARWLTRGALRILCYHGIWTAPAAHYGDKLFMGADKFKRRMALLGRSCAVLPLGDAVQRLRNGTLPAFPVVVTIDDGWHGTHSHAIPALLEHQVPATIYVTTYYVGTNLPVLNVLIGYMFETTSASEVDWKSIHPEAASDFSLASAAGRDRACAYWVEFISRLERPEREACARKLGVALAIDDYDLIIQSRTFHLMTSDEIAAAIEQGIDIQLHTHRHTFPIGDPPALAREINDNRSALEAIGVRGLTHFCYPSGRYDIETARLLTSLGVESATTLVPGLNYPDTPALELRRLADGERTSDIRFEAELSGITEIIRNPVRIAAWALRPHSRAPA